MLKLTLELTNEEAESLLKSPAMKKADEAFRNAIVIAADDPRDPAALTYQAWRKIIGPLERHAQKLSEPAGKKPLRLVA